MTNQRNSTLLAFVQQEIKSRGVKNIGLRNLNRLRTIIEQYIADCCLLPIAPFSSNFLRVAHSMLVEMTGVPVKHKLQPVLRALNAVLNCCPEYFNGSRLALTVDNTEGDAVVDFTVSGDANFNVYINWGDGSEIEKFENSNTYNITHTYSQESTFTFYVNFTDAENVTDVNFSNSVNITSAFNFNLLTNLEVIDLSGNALTTFDPAVALPITLQSLNLSDNEIAVFNPTIALPSALETLNLSSNNLTAFALTTTVPATITTLDLSDNDMDVAAVNNALVYIDGQTFNVGAKTLNITQTIPATPTGVGATAVTSLEGEG